MENDTVGSTYKCGLLGKTLGHSFSPLIHSRLANYQYLLYEKEPENVEDFLRNGDYDGLNVTIPYKKIAFSLCDEVSSAAKKIGSVNTILRSKSGFLNCLLYTSPSPRD